MNLFNPNKIKQAREAAGLTQTGLASAIGVHKNTVLRWEKGERPINLDEFLAVCRETKSSPEQMIKEFEGAAETLTPYGNLTPEPDLERMGQVVAAIYELLQHEGKALPPKVFGTLCAEAFLVSQRHPDLRGRALLLSVRHLIRLALASAQGGSTTEEECDCGESHK